MHIMAPVFINVDESGLHYEYEARLEKIVPHELASDYRHSDTGEDHEDAYAKRLIVGRGN